MGRKREKEIGRKVGGHNKGYWFRKGRGWYTSEGANRRLLDRKAHHHRTSSGGNG